MNQAPGPSIGPQRLSSTDPLTATDLLASGDGALHEAVLRQLNET